MQLDLCVRVLQLLLKTLDLNEHTLSLFLLLLQPVSEQQALLDSAFRSCWGLSDGLNEGVTDIVGTITSDLIVSSDVHDCLIQLFLDHFVVSEAFSADGQLSLDIGVALASLTLKLVELGAENVRLLT